MIVPVRSTPAQMRFNAISWRKLFWVFEPSSGYFHCSKALGVMR